MEALDAAEFHEIAGKPLYLTLIALLSRRRSLQTQPHLAL